MIYKLFQVDEAELLTTEETADLHQSENFISVKCIELCIYLSIIKYYVKVLKSKAFIINPILIAKKAYLIESHQK